MNTRLLMTLSALFLGTLGAGITFLPQELLVHLGINPETLTVLLIQLLGASYLGAGFLNWTNRGKAMGGIYGRPVAMANFANFAIGALGLLKGLRATNFALEVVIITALYSGFAIWFGLVLFTNPAAETVK